MMHVELSDSENPDFSGMCDKGTEESKYDSHAMPDPYSRHGSKICGIEPRS